MVLVHLRISQMRDRGVLFSVMFHMTEDRNPPKPSSMYLKLRLYHKDATSLQKTEFKTAYVAY